MSGTIYLGAPQGDLWPLSLDVVEANLRDRFPDATLHRVISAIRGRHCLSFDIPLGDGRDRHGLYVDGGNLSLSDGTPVDWAETIAWFLALLPARTPVVVMLEAEAVPVPLPDGTATPDAIRELLERMAGGSTSPTA